MSNWNFCCICCICNVTFYSLFPVGTSEQNQFLTLMSCVVAFLWRNKEGSWRVGEGGLEAPTTEAPSLGSGLHRILGTSRLCSPIWPFPSFFFVGCPGSLWLKGSLLWLSVVMVCGFSCPAACGILVPWSEMEPGSPALQSGFLSTGPPGKTPDFSLLDRKEHLKQRTKKASLENEEACKIGDCELVRNRVAIGELGLWVEPCLPSTWRILPDTLLVKILG